MAEKQLVRPVMLVMLDGWGWREDAADNAVRQASTPEFRPALGRRPARLPAHLGPRCRAAAGADGQFRGRPPQYRRRPGGDAGPAAHRPRRSRTARIGRAPALTGLIETLKPRAAPATCWAWSRPAACIPTRTTRWRWPRLVADAGVPVDPRLHRRPRHPAAIRPARISAACDAALPEAVRIATVSGRYYAMDRDKRWDRVGKAYHAMAEAKGAALRRRRRRRSTPPMRRDVTDEFVVPAVIGGYRGMRDGDGLLCFNFRADRVREILAALLDPDFDGFAAPARHPLRRRRRA